MNSIKYVICFKLVLSITVQLIVDLCWLYHLSPFLHAEILQSFIKHIQHNVAKSTLYHYYIDNNNSYYILYVYLYILVEEEYEGLSEKLYLQSKYFLDLLILRGDLSPSQLSVIQTEHSIMCIMFYYLFIIH